MLQVAVCPLVGVERRLYCMGVQGGVVGQWTVSGCVGDGFFE